MPGLEYVEWHEDEKTSVRRSKNRTQQSLAASQSALPSCHATQNMWTLPVSAFLPSNVSQNGAIKSVKFSMELCDKSLESQGMEVSKESYCHHTYTSIQSERGSAPQSLDDLPHWRSMYPHLQLDDGQGAQTPIFLFDAGLSLIDTFVPNTVIGIDLCIEFAYGASYRNWQLQLQIYDEQAPSGILFKRDIDEFRSINQDVELTLPFLASYWVDLFANFNNAKHVAMISGDAARINLEEESPRRFLSKVFAMQELWATPHFKDAQPKRMAILLWRFHQTAGGETPTTSWRQLIPASDKARVHSSRAQPMDRSSNIDPILETNFPLSQHSLLPYTDDEYDQRQLEATSAEICDQTFMSPQILPSKDSSPESGLQTGTESSVPSACLSFQSSVSDSTLHTQPSQQSSFDSQDERCTYTSFESFASQKSPCDINAQPVEYDLNGAAMILHDDQVYDIDETICASQDQSEAFFQGFTGFPTFEANYDCQPIDECAAIAHPQDFTSGDIQIPYEDMPPQLECQPPAEHPISPLQPKQQQQAQHDQEEDGCKIPLAAPQAHLISQYHILQLESFEELNQQASSPEPGRVYEVKDEEDGSVIVGSPSQAQPQDNNNRVDNNEARHLSLEDEFTQIQRHYVKPPQDQGEEQEQEEEAVYAMPPEPPSDDLQHDGQQRGFCLDGCADGISYEGLEDWHGQVGPDAFVQGNGVVEKPDLPLRVKEEDEEEKADDGLGFSE